MINNVSFTGRIRNQAGNFANGHSWIDTTEKEDTEMLKKWNAKLSDPKTINIAQMEDSGTISIKNMSITASDKFDPAIKFSNKKTGETYTITPKDTTAENSQLYTNLFKQFNKLKDAISEGFRETSINSFLFPED